MKRPRHLVVTVGCALALGPAAAAAQPLDTSGATLCEVHGFQGSYIEVTATPIGGKPVRGWSYKPCSSQLTTCDGGISEP
jgi:hypothetical protein